MGEYHFPNWANILGWLIAGLSMSCIPLVAIYSLITTKGTFKQVRINMNNRSGLDDDK